MVSPLTKQKKVMPLVTLVTYIEQLNIRILLKLRGEGGNNLVKKWFSRSFPVLRNNHIAEYRYVLMRLC